MTSQTDSFAAEVPPGSEPQLAGEKPAASRAFHESPLFWLSSLIALGFLLPYIPVPNLAVVITGAIVITIFYTFAIVQLIAQFARLRLSPLVVGGIFIACLALWAVLNFQIWELVRIPRDVRPDPLQLLSAVAVRTLIDTSLLCSAALGGALLSRLISEPNMLAPVSALIALIDIWGVLFGGIVSQLMEKAPTVSKHAMASMPMAGAATNSTFHIPLPSIGAGDFLFMGLLFSALCNNNMNWRGAAKWVTPLVALALLSVVFSPFFSLPGLLFIGLGVAIPNWRYFTFSKDEKFALLWAGVFVVFLTAGLYFAAPFIVGSAQKLEGGQPPVKTTAPARGVAGRAKK